MARKLFLWVAVAVCYWAVYSQAQYLWAYFVNPSNPVRLENLEGAFLVGVISSITWLPLLLVVRRSKDNLSPIQRNLGFTASSAVVLMSLASAVAGFVT